jgi:hypothetical protein
MREGGREGREGETERETEGGSNTDTTEGRRDGGTEQGGWLTSSGVARTRYRAPATEPPLQGPTRPHTLQLQGPAHATDATGRAHATEPPRDGGTGQEKRKRKRRWARSHLP